MAQPTKEIWTIQDIIKVSVEYMERHGFERPRVDVEVMLGQVMGLSRIELYCKYDQPLKAEEREAFKSKLAKRSTGYPLAYLVGSQPFYKYDFEIVEGLLVPRQDTELLVEKCLDFLADTNEAIDILDIGTGTGCVSVSLLCELKHAKAVAWDVEDIALAISQKNAEKLGVDDRFSVFQVDALDPSSYQALSSDFVQKFDVIVSNPPYISKDSPDIASSVKAYEPESALFAANQGMAFYEAIAKNGPRLLKPSGKLIVEIGFDQGERVSELFLQCGFEEVTVYNDMSGNQRVVTAIWKKS